MREKYFRYNSKKDEPIIKDNEKDKAQETSGVA